MPKLLAAAILSMIGMSLADAPQAMAAEKLNISFTVDSVASSAPFFIASAKGYFAAEGLDVQFNKQVNAGNVTASVLSGAADIGCVGFSAGFFNVSGNGDLRVIAGEVSERPGFKSQVFVANNTAYENGLKSPADLAGKKIAVSNFGGGLYYDLLLASEKYHFPIKKSDILQLQSNGNIASAITAGAVDAGVLSSVTAIKIASAGQAKIIGWVGDETPYMPISIFTSKATIAAKRGELVKALRATLRGQADYAAALEQRDAHGDVIHGKSYNEILGILAKNVGQTPASIAEAIPYVEPRGDIDAADILKQIAIWKKTGLVKASVTGKDLIDESLLTEARLEH
jgi:NitT/TauT family transport system substrate-binding protein